MDETVANTTQALFQNVWCVYPISGTYTRAQRVLFYFNIAIAFVFRFHDWLSTVAFCAATLYTAVTIFHSILMSFQTSLGADPDFIPTQSILFTSVLCSLVARQLSPRYLGADLDVYYNCWIIVVSLASIIVVWHTPSFTSSIKNYVVQQVCLPSSSCPNPCRDMDVEARFRNSEEEMLGVVVQSWWDTLGDSYGNKTPLAVPIPVPPDTPGIVPEYYSRLSVPGLIALITVLYPLFVLAVRNKMKPPRASRNGFFKRLMQRRVLKRTCRGSLRRFQFYAVYYFHVCWKVISYLSPKLPVPGFLVGLEGRTQSWIDDRSHLVLVDSEWRRQKAKYLSFSWYLCRMLAYLLFPALLVYRILYYELSWLAHIPESEGLYAIGQWGPILGLGLTLLGTCVAHFVFSSSPTKSWMTRGGDEQHPDPFARKTKPGIGWYYEFTPFGLISAEWEDLTDWWHEPFQVSIDDRFVQGTEPESVQLEDLTHDGISLSRSTTRRRQQTW